MQISGSFAIGFKELLAVPLVLSTPLHDIDDAHAVRSVAISWAGKRSALSRVLVTTNEKVLATESLRLHLYHPQSMNRRRWHVYKLAQVPRTTQDEATKQREKDTYLLYLRSHRSRATSFAPDPPQAVLSNHHEV